MYRKPYRTLRVNYPDIKWDDSWSGKRNNMFVECIRDVYLIQKVTKPTRHREGQRSTVDDLILVSQDKLISDILYFDPLGKSDHDVLVFDIKDAVLQGMDKYIPKIKINDNKKIKPLWMTQEVVKSVKKKYNLY